MNAVTVTVESKLRELTEAWRTAQSRLETLRTRVREAETTVRNLQKSLAVEKEHETQVWTAMSDLRGTLGAYDGVPTT